MKCKEKDDILFECQFNKVLPEDQITWFKNGAEIKKDDRTFISADGLRHFLSIRNATVDDAGNYSIKIRDLNSSASCKVKGEI